MKEKDGGKENVETEKREKKVLHRIEKIERTEKIEVQEKVYIYFISIVIYIFNFNLLVLKK